MSILVYFLKMTLCSGILFGYYHLFLRNQRFHHYNRFYLLACLLLSVLVPLIRIPVFEATGTMNQVAYQTAKVVTIPTHVTDNAGRMAPDTINYFTPGTLLWLIYAGGICLLLFGVVRGLLYIRTLSKRYQYEPMQGMRFYQTHEPGTPFSFFRSIYWNEALDLNSSEGQQIFRHELFHVQQRHSADTMLAEIVTVLGWFNPFFHLIRRELRAIHEFLADQYAASGSNRYRYAELLVQQVMASRAASLTSPFFQNQLKRRIAMITQLNQSPYGYWSRVMILPVATILFFSITLHAQDKQAKRTDAKDTTAIDTIPASQLRAMKEQLIQLQEKAVRSEQKVHLDEQYRAALLQHLESLKKKKEITFFYNQKLLRENELRNNLAKQKMLESTLQAQGGKFNEKVATAAKEELMLLKLKQQLLTDKTVSEPKTSVDKLQESIITNDPRVLEAKIKALEAEKKWHQEQLLALIARKQQEAIKNEVMSEKLLHDKLQSAAPDNALKSEADSVKLVLARYFNRSFRYPAVMVDNDGEGSIWFSFQLSESGKLADFEVYEAAPAASVIQELVIVGYGSKAPTKALTNEEKKDMMKAEIIRIAENGKGLNGQFKPARYYYQATFRLGNRNATSTKTAPNDQ